MPKFEADRPAIAAMGEGEPTPSEVRKAMRLLAKEGMRLTYRDAWPLVRVAKRRWIEWQQHENFIKFLFWLQTSGDQEAVQLRTALDAAAAPAPDAPQVKERAADDRSVRPQGVKCAPKMKD